MLDNYTTLQQLLLLPAILFGLFQIALLLSLIIRGGVVSYWWGVWSIVLFAAVILL